MTTEPIKTVRLEVSNLGHVPSFKNNKIIFRDKRTGRLRLITKPEYQKWMAACIQSFMSQLYSISQTIGDETLTGPQRRSLIALSLPLDDSVQWITQLQINVQKVPKDSEGAVITVTPL